MRKICKGDCRVFQWEIRIFIFSFERWVCSIGVNKINTIAQQQSMMHFQAKHADRTDLLFSEQVESYLHSRASNPSRPAHTPNPEDAHLIDRLLLALRPYRPLSDLLDLQQLAGAETKRYRESVYWGETREGRRHGCGVMLYAAGRVFEGHWAENLRSGLGFQRFSNGSTYRGSYVRGKPEGCGRYQWQNGEIYEGEWRAGLKHGSGIWRGSKGDSYIGEWQEGRAEGYGVHTWTNGDRYQGEFRNCLKHGEGVQRFANGDTYKGNYQNGKPSGYGEYYWASGSFFKGNFRGGLRNGQGVWKKGPGRTDKYEGEWVDDKKEGYGVFTSADGSVYKGHYVNDLREGFGELTSANGSVYRGNWAGDQQTDPVQASIQHDEDCQLFVPSQGYFPQSQTGEIINNIHPYYQEGQPQPAPLYHQPQPPAILKSASRNFRPRSLAKSGSRAQQRSRGESQCGKARGMSKKLSVGTVAGKPNPYRQANEQMLASSFFLYKLSGREAQSREQISRRQVRTSGGSRGRQANVDEELKYFARSKISSFSQLQ